ncbi:MAG: DUF3179 domain-containing protein, partial [Chloroflexi bacterium]|nr:DUF3179 domain-containing protein [Chloroflexota bacterium]
TPFPGESPAGRSDVSTTGEPENVPNVQGWNTDWSKSTIDLSELRRGLAASDPRDVISPIDEPKLEKVAEVDWLDDREPVALAKAGGEARAYPLRILTWHEVVNDELGGVPVAVTYCPLCNSAVGFEREVEGRVLTFGVSGLLRNSDLVMWDRQTESLWQQISGEGIVGELAGTQLTLVPVTLVSWETFREEFPDGTVLSQDTGFGRSYGINPYDFYDSSSRPFLFNGEVDDRFPAMERVLATIVGETNKAYPFSVISEKRAVNDEVAGEPIVVFWGDESTASALSDPEIAEGRSVGTGAAYLRTVDGQVLTFRPAGEDLFKDNETGTTWTLLGKGVDGPLAGEKLEPVIADTPLWFAWAAFNDGSPVYEGA